MIIRLLGHLSLFLVAAASALYYMVVPESNIPACGWACDDAEHNTMGLPPLLPTASLAR